MSNNPPQNNPEPTVIKIMADAKQAFDTIDALEARVKNIKPITIPVNTGQAVAAAKEVETALTSSLTKIGISTKMQTAAMSVFADMLSKLPVDKVVALDKEFSSLKQAISEVGNGKFADILTTKLTALLGAGKLTKDEFDALVASIAQSAAKFGASQETISAYTKRVDTLKLSLQAARDAADPTKMPTGKGAVVVPQEKSFDEYVLGNKPSKAAAAADLTKTTTGEKELSTEVNVVNQALQKQFDQLQSLQSTINNSTATDEKKAAAQKAISDAYNAAAVAARAYFDSQSKSSDSFTTGGGSSIKGLGSIKTDLKNVLDDVGKEFPAQVAKNIDAPLNTANAQFLEMKRMIEGTSDSVKNSGETDAQKARQITTLTNLYKDYDAELEKIAKQNSVSVDFIKQGGGADPSDKLKAKTTAAVSHVQSELMNVSGDEAQKMQELWGAVVNKFNRDYQAAINKNGAMDAAAARKFEQEWRAAHIANERLDMQQAAAFDKVWSAAMAEQTNRVQKLNKEKEKDLYFATIENKKRDAAASAKNSTAPNLGQTDEEVQRLLRLGESAEIAASGHTSLARGLGLSGTSLYRLGEAASTVVPQLSSVTGLLGALAASLGPVDIAIVTFIAVLNVLNEVNRQVMVLEDQRFRQMAIEGATYAEVTAAAREYLAAKHALFLGPSGANLQTGLVSGIEKAEGQNLERRKEIEAEMAKTSAAMLKPENAANIDLLTEAYKLQKSALDALTASTNDLAEAKTRTLATPAYSEAEMRQSALMGNASRVVTENLQQGTLAAQEQAHSADELYVAYLKVYGIKLEDTVKGLKGPIVDQQSGYVQPLAADDKVFNDNVQKAQELKIQADIDFAIQTGRRIVKEQSQKQALIQLEARVVLDQNSVDLLRAKAEKLTEEIAQQPASQRPQLMVEATAKIQELGDQLGLPRAMIADTETFSRLIGDIPMDKLMEKTHLTEAQMVELTKQVEAYNNTAVHGTAAELEGRNKLIGSYVLEATAANARLKGYDEEINATRRLSDMKARDAQVLAMPKPQQDILSRQVNDYVASSVAAGKATLEISQGVENIRIAFLNAQAASDAFYNSQTAGAAKAQIAAALVGGAMQNIAQMAFANSQAITAAARERDKALANLDWMIANQPRWDMYWRDQLRSINEFQISWTRSEEDYNRQRMREQDSYNLQSARTADQYRREDFRNLQEYEIRRKREDEDFRIQQMQSQIQYTFNLQDAVASGNAIAVLKLQRNYAEQQREALLANALRIQRENEDRAREIGIRDEQRAYDLRIRQEDYARQRDLAAADRAIQEQRTKDDFERQQALAKQNHDQMLLELQTSWAFQRKEIQNSYALQLKDIDNGLKIQLQTMAFQMGLQKGVTKETAEAIFAEYDRQFGTGNGAITKMLMGFFMLGNTAVKPSLDASNVKFNMSELRLLNAEARTDLERTAKLTVDGTDAMGVISGVKNSLPATKLTTKYDFQYDQGAKDIWDEINQIPKSSTLTLNANPAIEAATKSALKVTEANTAAIAGSTANMDTNVAGIKDITERESNGITPSGRVQSDILANIKTIMGYAGTISQDANLTVTFLALILQAINTGEYQKLDAIITNTNRITPSASVDFGTLKTDVPLIKSATYGDYSTLTIANNNAANASTNAVSASNAAGDAASAAGSAKDNTSSNSSIAINSSYSAGQIASRGDGTLGGNTAQIWTEVKGNFGGEALHYVLKDGGPIRKVIGDIINQLDDSSNTSTVHGKVKAIHTDTTQTWGTTFLKSMVSDIWNNGNPLKPASELSPVVIGILPQSTTTPDSASSGGASAQVNIQLDVTGDTSKLSPNFKDELLGVLAKAIVEATPPKLLAGAR